MSSKSGGAKASRKEEGRRVVAENRRARFDYEILDTYEAGIELKGTEVKSLREGRTNLAESYAAMKAGELFLVNANIPEYKQGNRFNHEPKRTRKLLLHRRQIDKLANGVLREGLTIVPLKLYFNQRGRAKLDIALAKGKKIHDKRETIKERDWSREKSRLLRDRG
jgi:SsrA-binding protein